jgi:hypothetical protein
MQFSKPSNEVDLIFTCKSLVLVEPIIYFTCQTATMMEITSYIQPQFIISSGS